MREEGESRWEIEGEGKKEEGDGEKDKKGRKKK